jgi:hypothetical protein
MTLTYQTGMRCPNCSGKNWHVGRVSAECGKCSFAAPLEGARKGAGTFRVTGGTEPGRKGVNRA